MVTHKMPLNRSEVGLRTILALHIMVAGSAATEEAGHGPRGTRENPHLIPRTETPLNIDGILDEAAWNGALVLELPYEVSPAENTAALHVELTDEGPWQANDEIGDEEDRLRASSYQTILFRRGQYTSELVITEGSQDGMDLLILFATHIDQEITE